MQHLSHVTLHSFYNLLMSYFLHVHLEMIIVPVRMSKEGDAVRITEVSVAPSDSLANTTVLLSSQHTHPSMDMS